MALTLDPELKDSIDSILARLERVAGGGGDLQNQTALLEVRMELGDLLDDWARRRLGNALGSPVDLQLVARSLAEIHMELSGAESVSVRANGRSMVMEVNNCPGYRSCSSKSSVSWCLSNMVVAAIMQRAMQTPVMTDVHLKKGGCVHEHRPAWLVELVSELDQFGAEGMVMLYGDRLLFSHLPSDEQAEMLSEELMRHEESGTGLPSGGIKYRNRKIMLLHFGKIFVSICLKTGGADEDRIRGHIESTLRAAELI